MTWQGREIVGIRNWALGDEEGIEVSGSSRSSVGLMRGHLSDEDKLPIRLSCWPGLSARAACQGARERMP